MTLLTELAQGGALSRPRFEVDQHGARRSIRGSPEQNISAVWFRRLLEPRRSGGLGSQVGLCTQKNSHHNLEGHFSGKFPSSTASGWGEGALPRSFHEPEETAATKRQAARGKEAYPWLNFHAILVMFWFCPAQVTFLTSEDLCVVQPLQPL